MAKNELQKMFDNIPDKSYREKVEQIEDYFISIADGVDIIGNGKEITYAEGLCDYKHSFADGIYIRAKNCIRYRGLYHCYGTREPY